MNPVLLDFGFIQIEWYSLFVLLAIIVGGYLALREAKRFNLSEDFMINLFFFLIPFAIIGARLYYVMFNWGLYKDNLIDIVKIWEGGLAIHGAIIVGALWVIIYAKKYKVNVLRLMDILMVGLLIGQAIGRWGNFFNSEAHGSAVTLDFLQKLHLPNFIVEGMHINGTYYHPTFLYESLWCLIGFIVLLIIRRRENNKIGYITSLYLMWYAIGRFLIESLRTDSLMLMDFKVAQIASILMFVSGLIMFIVLLKSFSLDSQYNDWSNADEVGF